MLILSICCAKWINARYERSGVLLQGQFQGVPVREDRHLLHPTAYLHLNPVRAGITNDPCGWAFSSYQDDRGMRAGTLPAAELSLAIAGGRDVYAAFVMSFTFKEEQAIAPMLLED